nr:uncharacterized protein LOC113809304 [Penaeus vannamei]
MSKKALLQYLADSFCNKKQTLAITTCVRILLLLLWLVVNSSKNDLVGACGNVLTRHIYASWGVAEAEQTSGPEVGQLANTCEAWVGRGMQDHSDIPFCSVSSADSEEREVSAVTDSLPPRGFRRRETVIICHDITSPLALCPPCPVDRKGCVTLDVSRIVFRLCLRRAEECLGSGCLGEVSNLRPSRSPLRMAAFDPVPCAPMILRTWHVGLVP